MSNWDNDCDYSPIYSNLSKLHENKKVETNNYEQYRGTFRNIRQNDKIIRLLFSVVYCTASIILWILSKYL